MHENNPTALMLDHIQHLGGGPGAFPAVARVDGPEGGRLTVSQEIQKRGRRGLAVGWTELPWGHPETRERLSTGPDIPHRSQRPCLPGIQMGLRVVANLVPVGQQPGNKPGVGLCPASDHKETGTHIVLC